MEQGSEFWAFMSSFPGEKGKDSDIGHEDCHHDARHGSGFWLLHGDAGDDTQYVETGTNHFLPVDVQDAKVVRAVRRLPEC